MKNMKKLMLAALALIMVLGSMKAFASDNIDYDIMEGKINASQGNRIWAMIGEMKQFQVEADQLEPVDGFHPVGVVSRLMREAQLINQEVAVDSSFEKITQALKEVKELRDSACSIVRDEASCK